MRLTFLDDIRSSGFAQRFSEVYFGPPGPVLRTIAKWPPDLFARQTMKGSLSLEQKTMRGCEQNDGEWDTAHVTGTAKEGKRSPANLIVVTIFNPDGKRDNYNN